MSSKLPKMTMRDLARTGFPSLSGLITSTHIHGRALPIRILLNGPMNPPSPEDKASSIAKN